MANDNGKIYALAIVACVLIAGMAFVYGGTKAVPVVVQKHANLSMVSISATGVAKGMPANASIDIFINGTGPTASAATKNLSNAISIFNSTVYQYVNGNRSLIQTQYYSASRVYSYNATTNTVYQAYESITVTLPSLSKLSSFLANMTNVPNLQIQRVSASLSDAQVETLRPVALQSAIANATAQAQAVIGSGTIVNSSITVEGYNIYPYPLYASSGPGYANLKTQGPLYYNGTSSIEENVEATFYYKR